MKVHYKSDKQDWETPDDLFNLLDKEFNFTLDPAASEHNAKCSNYFTKKEDGLKQSWQGHTVFLNPPYGREIRFWVEKASKEANKDTKIVMLIPSRTDTRYWHDYIFPHAKEIRFLRGRITFKGAKGQAPFPSAIVIF